MHTKPKSPIELKDRSLKSLSKKRAPAGATWDVMDARLRGFGVRINEHGTLTFFLAARYGGRDSNPTRRAIGRYGQVSLAAARRTAETWKGMIDQGLDPQAEAERERREKDRRRGNTVAAVAEDFIAALDPTERKRDEVARDVRRELVGAWGSRPIVEIGPRDVVDLVQTIKGRGAPHQARNVLGYARRLFGWAIAQHAYGLDRSPCETLRPEKIIGRKVARKRILDDDELRALWRAAGRLGYPYGPLFRLLLLTGARKSEIAAARWSEIDLARRVLVIPADRQKSDEAHVIPLCDDALAILTALPRFDGGDYVFSTTAGEKPVNGFSKGKERLDRRMLRSWRAIGRAAASDRRKASIPAWVIHDIRRTMRTHLSALPIPQHVAERIIGHAQPGLIQTYDRFAYLDEKRAGLAMWETRLRSIVAPKVSPPGADNVILWKSPAPVTA